MTSAFIHKAGPELKHLGPFDLLKAVEQRLKRDQSFRVVDNSFGSCFGYMFFSLTIIIVKKKKIKFFKWNSLLKL